MSEGGAGSSGRRRDEERRRGVVAFSPTLAGAAALLAAALALAVTGPLAGQRFVALARRSWGAGAGLDGMGAEAVAAFAWAAGPPLVAALAAAVTIGVLQTRGLLSLGAVGPSAGRRRRDGVMRALALLAIAAAAAVVAVRREEAALAAAWAGHGAVLLSATMEVALRIVIRVAVVMVLAGAGDFALRYLAAQRALRTTRAEAARDAREDHADPRWRAENRRRQRG